MVNKMMLAKAEIDSVVVDDKTVDIQLDSRMSYMVQQFGSEKNIVEAYGKSLDLLKSELRTQVKDQAIVQKMQAKITNDIKVTPRDVKKFFEGIPKDSLPYFSIEVEVGQIIVPAQVNDKAKQAALAKLNDLRAQVQAGAEVVKLFDAGQAVVSPAVWKGKEAVVKLGRPEPIVVAVAAGSAGKIKTQVARPEPLVAPFKKGQQVGSLKILNGDNPEPMAEVPLVALEAVEEAGIMGRAWDSIRLWIK